MVRRRHHLLVKGAEVGLIRVVPARLELVQDSFLHLLEMASSAGSRLLDRHGGVHGRRVRHDLLLLFVDLILFHSRRFVKFGQSTDTLIVTFFHAGVVAHTRGRDFLILSTLRVLFAALKLG